MGDVLLVILAIILFTLASMAYWRVLRILSAIIQILAYVAGITTTLSVAETEGTVSGLLAGVEVYLLLFSLVIIVRRLGNLEAEVVKLGGSPTTPMFLEFLQEKLSNRSKKKRTE